jgi:two-component system response regulator HydG
MSTKQKEASPIPPGRFLIVDDEELILNVWKRALERKGHTVFTFESGHDALRFYKEDHADVAIIDYMMPEMNGLQLLKHLKELEHAPEVVMMTGYASIDTALEAMKSGAYDYLQKPFEQIEIAVRVAEKALERKKLAEVNRELEERLASIEQFEGIIGSSAPMKKVFKLVEQVSKFDATVMIQGETGTGKERIARAIHMKSERANKPFIPVVCSAFPENLIESALFGYRKGAFTGANTDKAGMIEAADGGTLFLDEVGDIPLPIQVKLLRVLQEGEFQRLGDVRPTPVDLRVITATHVNLVDAVSEGSFREDLYYRIKVIEIELPPLRDRIEDIPALTHHFMSMYSKRYGKQINKISTEALLCLQGYNWPGNVRQLEHTIARAFILEETDELSIHSLPDELRDVEPVGPLPSLQQYSQMQFKEAKQLMVERFEKQYLTNLLDESEQNISQSARKAGMDRANFRRLLKRCDLI